MHDVICIALARAIALNAINVLFFKVVRIKNQGGKDKKIQGSKRDGSKAESRSVSGENALE